MMTELKCSGAQDVGGKTEMKILKCGIEPVVKGCKEKALYTPVPWVLIVIFHYI